MTPNLPNILPNANVGKTQLIKELAAKHGIAVLDVPLVKPTPKDFKLWKLTHRTQIVLLK